MSTVRRLVAAVSVTAAVPLLALSGPAVLPAVAAPGTPGCPSVPSSSYTIPSPVGAPAATSLSGGGIGFATIGRDLHPYFVATDISDKANLRVGPLTCFGGGGSGRPGLADSPSQLALAVRSNASNQIYLRYLRDAGFTGWTAVPRAIGASGPAAIYTADGRLHLAFRGTNNNLYHMALTGGGWSLDNLGGPIAGTPDIARGPAGGVAIFATGTNHKSYVNTGDTGHWGGFASLGGGTNHSPAVAANFQSGRLDLFVTGQAGGLFSNTYAAGRWNGWVRQDNTLPADAEIGAAGDPGHLVVYYTSPTQDSPPPGQTGPGVTGYKHYSAGWDTEYFYAPYTYPDGAPDGTTATRTTSGTRRQVAPRLAVR